MSSKLENCIHLPGEIFEKVGSSLEGEQTKKEEDLNTNSSLKPEELSSRPENGDNNDNEGILITEQKSIRSGSISEISVNSFDVDAVDELYRHSDEQKKNRKIIIALSAFCIILISSLYCVKRAANTREQSLLAQIDLLNHELNTLKFDVEMSNPCSENALFEIDNCYFNIQASGKLGECAEDLTQSAQDWYGWSLNRIHYLLEDASFNGEDQTEDNDDTDINKAYDSWYTWGEAVGETMIDGFNSFFNEVFVEDDVDNENDEMWFL